MRVGVIGTEHVGLVTAATLASLGREVSAVDSDAEKIDMLRTNLRGGCGMSQVLV